MKIARVVGSAVATVKADGLAGSMLLVVQETTPDGETLVGQPFVAVDGAGSGAGELVLVSCGSAARAVAGGEARPTDALIVGILDSVNLGGADVFRKS